MPEFIIRPAKEKDIPAIKNCVDTAFSKYTESVCKPSRTMLVGYPEYVTEGKVWVAETEGNLCGTLVLFPIDMGFYVDTVAVSPPFQGHGVGHTLLEFAEQEALRRGCTDIYLCTNVNMAENQLLYHKIGYVEYSRYLGDGWDRIFYHKQLS